MTTTATKTRKTSKKSFTKTPEERRADQQAAHDKLTAAVEKLSTSEGWKAYLKAASTFHRYSFSNVMLIMTQYPEASQVAGYRKWQEVGRQVRKGEKAIRIFGFAKKTEINEATGKEEEKVYFPLVSVFALEQTDIVDEDKWNKIANAEGGAKLLEGEDEQGIGDAVSEYLTREGWDVAAEKITNGANGYTDFQAKRVRVRDDVKPAQRAKTLVHEAGHIACDHGKNPIEYLLHRGRMECEAEGVAYVVGDALGLDTSDYSVAYLTGWSGGDIDMIRETAEAVLKAAKVILEGIKPAE